MKTHWVVFAIMVAAGLLVVAGCGATESAGLTPADKAVLADAVSASLVKVEYTVQYDKGEAPHAEGYAQRCPYCGQYHSQSIEHLISEERPLEAPGFLISPARVVTPDIIVHPRFIKSIAVRQGDQVIPASVSAYAQRQNAVFLELDKPLEGAKPLDFTAPSGPPYFAVTYGVSNAQWTTTVQSIPAGTAVSEDGPRFAPVPSHCLIVSADGQPAGVSMIDELPLDDSWQGSPADWPVVSAEDMTKALADLEAKAEKALLRVSLSFRSPKKSAREMMYSRYGAEEDESTERNVPGVLVAERRVLVLTNLKARTTARLERIVVHGADGQAMPAKFAGTLNDYGCFVAELDEPAAGAVELSDAGILSVRNALLLAAEMRIQGETRVTYFNHGRIPAFRLGWRRQVYPNAGNYSDGTFYFTQDGKLLALPVARREKVSQDRWRDDEPMLTSSNYVAAVLGDLPANLDASNVPVSEAEENRLAWLGVELQALDKELARINNVSDLTRDGQTGALVSYVYEGSPAAAAGIKPGDVLLRLHVEGEPKPVEVVIEDFGFGATRAFPWERLDELPEQYYDQIPTPWPSADNTLNRQLTELGFGKKFTADFFADGKVVAKDFEVAQSPPYYDSAKRYKSDELGMTVRDLTYEVRRYFQKAPDAEGVIISRIEPGSKASVGGIKPYEMVTHVNDVPVRTAEQFGKLIEGRSELRLSIKRMTQGRVVKIKLTAAEPEAPAATAPATEPAATAPAETQPADAEVVPEVSAPAAAE